jgi:hypothetical protein
LLWNVTDESNSSNAEKSMRYHGREVRHLLNVDLVWLSFGFDQLVVGGAAAQAPFFGRQL